MESTWLEFQRFDNDDNIDLKGNAYGRSLTQTVTKGGISLLVTGTSGYGTLVSNKPSVYVFTNTNYDVDKENDDGRIFSKNVEQSGGQIWSQLATLTCRDANLLDQFGTSVDISDETIIVGAYYTDNGVGAAYVYDTSSSSSSSVLAWTQTAKLVASDGNPSDFFGISVGVKENYVFVGASGHSSTGTCYVFRSNNDGAGFRSWSQQAKLSSNVKGGFFGRSLALATTSDRVVVSSYGENQQAGSIYVYDNIGETWTQTARLTPPDSSYGDLFGYAVDIDNSNNIIATSIYDSSKFLKFAGSAYIFSYQQQSQSWNFNVKLVGETAYDSFGSAVSLCSKATSGLSSAAVSTIYKNNSMGSTFVYTFFTEQNPITTSWSQQAVLTPKGASINQYFGRSVSLSQGCSTMFVSSYSGSVPQNGHFYGFRKIVSNVVVVHNVHNIFLAVIGIFCAGIFVGLGIAIYIKTYRTRSSSMTKMRSPYDNNDDDDNTDTVSIQLTETRMSSTKSLPSSLIKETDIAQHSDMEMIIIPSLSLLLLTGILNVIITLRVNNKNSVVTALIISIALLSILPSLLIILELSQIRCCGIKFNCLDLIVARQLSKGSSNTIIILLSSLCGCDLLRLLPWSTNDYSRRNSGFPTYRLFQFCFGFSLLYHSVILGCLIVASSIIPNEMQYTLPIIITIALVVLRLLLMLMTSLERLCPSLTICKKCFGYNSTLNYNNTIVYDDNIKTDSTITNPFSRNNNDVNNNDNSSSSTHPLHPLDLAEQEENLIRQYPSPSLQSAPPAPPQTLDDDTLPSVRIVKKTKKRPEPKSLPPLRFKLPNKTNTNDNN